MRLWAFPTSPQTRLCCWFPWSHPSEANTTNLWCPVETTAVAILTSLPLMSPRQWAAWRKVFQWLRASLRHAEKLCEDWSLVWDLSLTSSWLNRKWGWTQKHYWHWHTTAYTFFFLFKATAVWWKPNLFLKWVLTVSYVASHMWKARSDFSMMKISKCELFYIPKTILASKSLH